MSQPTKTAPAGSPRTPSTSMTADQRKALKRKKLFDLSAKRVTRAINTIRLVGNLYAYAPTPVEAAAMVNALIAEVNKVKDRLTGSVVAAHAFHLPTE